MGESGKETHSNATVLLNAAARGEAGSRDALLALVYDQLCRHAQRQMGGERANHTLSATELVHEAYLRIAGPRELAWQNRAHFYAAVAEAMRRVLLDHAKGRARAKRGGGKPPAQLGESAMLTAENDENPCDLVAIDQAICRLKEKDPRMAEVVYLRYYAGLSTAEIALVLGVSERTVGADWSFAKAWLAKELGGKNL